MYTVKIKFGKLMKQIEKFQYITGKIFILNIHLSYKKTTLKRV